MIFFNTAHPGLNFYHFDYETVTAEGFEFDREVVFKTKKIADLNIGTDYFIRGFTEQYGRGSYKLLSTKLDLIENPNYIDYAFNRAWISDFESKSQGLYDKYWPVKRLDFLTFSTYVTPEGDIEDKTILTVGRDLYQHTDMFTDPLGFRNLAYAGFHLGERESGHYIFMDEPLEYEEIDSYFFPECEDGY